MFFIYCGVTKECAKEEVLERNSDDRWSNVDEPVRNEGSESEEKHVEECVIFVILDFCVELAQHAWEVFQDEPSAECIRKAVAATRSNGSALRDMQF